MNVLHLNTADYGGAGTGMLRQHFALLNEGVNSTVLTAIKHGPALPNVYTQNGPALKSAIVRLANRFNLLESNLRNENKIIEKLGQPYHKGGTFELFSSPFSDYNLHEHPLVKSADLINLHWVSGFVDIPLFFEKVKKPIVWTLHDMYPYLGGFHYDTDAINNPQLSNLENKYLTIKKNALQDVKYAVIGNSNWNTEHAKKSFMFTNSLLTETVYYPLNDKKFTSINKQLAKKALNLPKGKFIIGFACENLNNIRKGFKTLQEAIKLLPPDIKKNVHCLTFGEINSQNENKSEIYYTQMGPVYNTRLQSIIYSAMDTFVIPSKAEAFGLTALEAMACKTPVIGYAVGGIPEMVKNNSTGLLVTNSSAQSLSESIINMFYLNEDEREKMGKNAFNLVNNQHNSHTIASRYIQVYNTLR